MNLHELGEFEKNGKKFRVFWRIVEEIPEVEHIFRTSGIVGVGASDKEIALRVLEEFLEFAEPEGKEVTIIISHRLHTGTTAKETREVRGWLHRRFEAVVCNGRC